MGARWVALKRLMRRANGADDEAWEGLDRLACIHGDDTLGPDAATRRSLRKLRARRHEPQPGPARQQRRQRAWVHMVGVVMCAEDEVGRPKLLQRNRRRHHPAMRHGVPRYFSAKESER